MHKGKGKIERLFVPSQELALEKLKDLVADNLPTICLTPSWSLKGVCSEFVKSHRELEGAFELSSSKSEFVSGSERELLFKKVLSKESVLRKTVFSEGTQIGVQARAIARLFEELAIQSLSTEVIASKLEKRMQEEAPRWRSIQLLFEKYVELLHESSLKDLSELHLFADVGKIKRVVLFCILESFPIVQDVLNSWSERTGGVIKVIISTAGLSESCFGEFGELLSYPERRVSLPELQFVRDHRDYNREFRTLPKEFDIICPDGKEAEYLSAQLQRDGINTKNEFATPRSPTFSLIPVILEAKRSRRMFDLLTLVRFRPIEEKVATEINCDPGSLLSLLDKFRQDYLQLSFDGEIKGAETARKAIQYLKEQYVVPFENTLTSSEAIDALRNLSCLWPEDIEFQRALNRVARIRVEFDSSLEDICRFLRTAPPEKNLGDAENPAALIELSEATSLRERPFILVGATDKEFPQPSRGSSFLSEGLRKEFGLADRSKREALDRFRIDELAIAEKMHAVIVPRMSSNDDPTFPSPLVLPDTPIKLAEECIRFYEEPVATEARSTENRNAGNRSGDFKSPLSILIKNPAPILSSYSISAIDRYRETPFQYYLSDILQLSEEKDDSAELDPQLFGQVAHRALEKLVALEYSADRAELTDALTNEARAIFFGRFGENIPSSARTQLRHLEERFERLSFKEKDIRDDGWKVDASELNIAPGRVFIEVEGKRIGIHGRIDRIDRNGARIRIIDYKTEEKSPRPIFIEKGKNPRWDRLQLPLYVYLCREIGLIRDLRDVEVAYFYLSSSNVEIKTANINEERLEMALTDAREVLSRLISGDFAIGERERLATEYAVFSPNLAEDLSSDEADED